MLPQDQLISELKELNEYLDKRHRMGGTIEERRQRAQQKGVFANLSKLSVEEIASFFQGMPLVGVDGSLVNYGASYPYVLTFFRALAHTTSSSGSRERIWEQEVFAPLLPRYQGKIAEHIGRGQDAEEALAHLRWGILATLEAKVAVQALKAEPRLLVLDGGFARLKNHAPEIWNSLKDEVLEREVLMVGVTEEIATCALAQTFSPAGESDSPRVVGDREILFGLLEPGEIYQLYEGEGGEKGRFYVRFARHPQVVAVDYLKAQGNEVKTALNFLYSITPLYGRGIPLWLDVVDAEVRLTREEAEAMIATCLDPAVAEVFLRPLRANREL